MLYGAVIGIEITHFTFKRSLLVHENSVIINLWLYPNGVQNKF